MSRPPAIDISSDSGSDEETHKSTANVIVLLSPTPPLSKKPSPSFSGDSDAISLLSPPSPTPILLLFDSPVVVAEAPLALPAPSSHRKLSGVSDLISLEGDNKLEISDSPNSVKKLATMATQSELRHLEGGNTHPNTVHSSIVIGEEDFPNITEPVIAFSGSGKSISDKNNGSNKNGLFSSSITRCSRITEPPQNFAGTTDFVQLATDSLPDDDAFTDEDSGLQGGSQCQDAGRNQDPRKTPVGANKNDLKTMADAKKKQEKEQRARQKEETARLREDITRQNEDKARLVEERKRKRQEDKLQKAVVKAQKAEEKKLEKERKKWETGKLALNSIVAEIDSKVIENGSVGGHLLSRFAEKGLSYRVTRNPIEGSILWRMNVPDQFAEDLSSSTEVPYIAIVHQAEEFCHLVSAESFMDHVTKVRNQYPSFRICYVTNKLTSYIWKCEQSQYKKPSNSNSWRRPPVEEIFTKLTTHCNKVHSRQCIDEAELAEHIVGLTSSLANCQFKKKLTWLSINANGSIIPNDFVDKNLIKKNTWLKALIAIPKVQPRHGIAIWKKYPTMRSLLNVYLDPAKTVHEKELLLKDLKMEGLLANEDRRLGEVCSKRVYRILMAQNGRTKTDEVEDGADFFISSQTSI